MRDLQCINKLGHDGKADAGLVYKNRKWKKIAQIVTWHNTAIPLIRKNVFPPSHTHTHTAHSTHEHTYYARSDVAAALQLYRLNK